MMYIIFEPDHEKTNILHNENMSMQYTAIFHDSKNEKEMDKKNDNFLFFFLKQRL